MVHPHIEYERHHISAQRFEHLRSLETTELFDELAREYLIWERPYGQVLEERQGHDARWFPGGRLNLFHNLLGRHLETDRRNKAALVWRSIDYRERTYTYQRLAWEVERFGRALQNLGVKPGDPVFIFLPDIPELVIAALAAASIGAVHIVYHRAYASESIAERLLDCRARFIVTADSIHHGALALKDVLNEALMRIDYEIEHCVVVELSGRRVRMRPKRDLWYHNLVSDVIYTAESEKAQVIRNAEDPLLALYTSTNGPEPRGVVHRTAGYLLWSMFSTDLLFDLDERDTFWCTGELAWATGHMYGLYGPLALGSTLFLYEGAVTLDSTRSFFDFLDQYHVTVLYTNPQVLRSLMRAKSTKRHLNRYSNSLRLIGCGGSALREDVYNWAQFELTRGQSLPIINIWGQTETGGGLIAGIPGVKGYEDDTMMVPLPGVDVRLVTSDGKQIDVPDQPGALVLDRPHPALSQGFLDGPEAFRRQYWEKVRNRRCYFTGDGAMLDARGNFAMTGRVDKVLSTGGSRRSVEEVETLIAQHDMVREAAATVVDHPVRGYIMVAFVVLLEYRDESHSEEILREIREFIIEERGELALPEQIRFTKYLPKTPDNAISREMLREIALQIEGI